MARHELRQRHQHGPVDPFGGELIALPDVDHEPPPVRSLIGGLAHGHGRDAAGLVHEAALLGSSGASIEASEGSAASRASRASMAATRASRSRPDVSAAAVATASDSRSRAPVRFRSIPSGFPRTPWTKAAASLINP